MNTIQFFVLFNDSVPLFMNTKKKKIFLKSAFKTNVIFIRAMRIKRVT